MTVTISRKILMVFGTRPEAIKMAPLVLAMQKDPYFDLCVCVTGQHKEMLHQVLEIFKIKPDFDLNVMEHNQSLSQLTSKILISLKPVLSEFRPDLVLVHGDTTTTFAAALASFYEKIPVGHVEAGLRSGDLYSPWPEEANRKLVSIISEFHFAPTKSSEQHLIQEGISKEKISVTGNTVIDALLSVVQLNKDDHSFLRRTDAKYSFMSNGNRKILLTAHRRENLGKGIRSICLAMKRIAQKYPNIDIVIPMHLNPVVRADFQSILSEIDNVYLIEPLNYRTFVHFLHEAAIILTDSGGIQEEAPSLKKPVLVLRENTERPEAVDAGTVRLVGTNELDIFNNVVKLLNDRLYYSSFTSAKNPFGDGSASNKIIKFIKENLK